MAVSMIRGRQRAPVDAESLEHLVALCLEGLAELAATHGQEARAARLREAAALLTAPFDPHEALLTAREWDVALLVAKGHSNRLIGDELVVSERTIDTHVSHILRKLSLISRAQIAAWVVEQRRPFTLLA
jgi:DNA-binding NarL/FixJ family response regulator